MGFLKQLLPKKQEKKHTLGVCIPDASKKKIQEKANELPTGYGFVVSGIFHVQDSLMVQGTATCGTIKIKDKAKIGESKLVVKSIQVEGKDAKKLEHGQRGALFLIAEKGKAPIIKAGDVLEF